MNYYSVIKINKLSIQEKDIEESQICIANKRIYSEKALYYMIPYDSGKGKFVEAVKRSVVDRDLWGRGRCHTRDF